MGSLVSLSTSTWRKCGAETPKQKPGEVLFQCCEKCMDLHTRNTKQQLHKHMEH